METALHLIPRLSALRGFEFGNSLPLCLLVEASSFLTLGILLLATDICHTGSFCFILAHNSLVNLLLIVDQDHLKLGQSTRLFVECVNTESLLLFLIEKPLAAVLVVHVFRLVQDHFELEELLFLTFDLCNAAGFLLQVLLILLLEVSQLLLLTALLFFALGLLLFFPDAKLLVPLGLFLDLASNFLQIGGLIVDLSLFLEGLEPVLFLLLQSNLPLSGFLFLLLTDLCQAIRLSFSATHLLVVLILSLEARQLLLDKADSRETLCLLQESNLFQAFSFFLEASDLLFTLVFCHNLEVCLLRGFPFCFQSLLL